jgi:aspartate kinase
MKFGGSSVATPELIRHVAQIIREQKFKTPRLVVVVSAMGKTTDQLLKLAGEVSGNSQKYRRESDMLLTTGERVSMALLTMALLDLEISSISFTGSQSGIITDSEHGEARIVEIRPQRILEALDNGKVAIIAGFQGVSLQKEITTLGRGAGDTSAVAIGAALHADQVDIYTDVDGFFTADPRKVSGARKLQEIPLRLAYLAASRGAKVLHSRSLEIAYRHNTRVRVLSTFQPQNGGSMIVEKKTTPLEAPQALQICRQDKLCLLEIPAKFRDEAAQTFLADCLEVRMSASLCQVLLSEAQKMRWSERLTSRTDWLAVLKASAALTRISILGSGFDQDAEMPRKIRKILAELKVEALSEYFTESLVEIVAKENSGLDALTQRLHQEFIEKDGKCS